MSTRREPTTKATTRRQRQAILKQMLEESRRDVLTRLRTLREAPPPAPDEREMDGLVDELARDLEWALAEIESQTVRRIEAALRHLDDGTYGICGTCQVDINEARLRALPFAELCHQCQAQLEAREPAARAADQRPGIQL